MQTILGEESPTRSACAIDCRKPAMRSAVGWGALSDEIGSTTSFGRRSRTFSLRRRRHRHGSRYRCFRQSGGTSKRCRGNLASGGPAREPPRRPRAPSRPRLHACGRSGGWGEWRGQTTTIAKLAALLQREGSSVLLGAADSFRAAADNQLRAWADRIGADIVGGQPGADPASIAYDAYRAAKARHAGVVIVDTAGRLQSKANLMDELSKVARVLEREAGSIDEVLLVIDGTTGQERHSPGTSFLGGRRRYGYRHDEAGRHRAGRRGHRYRTGDGHSGEAHRPWRRVGGSRSIRAGRVRCRIAGS